ncbi:hypothetical protein [Streptomyces sp. NPDC045714]
MNSIEPTWFRSSRDTDDGPRLGCGPAAPATCADFATYASEA